MAAGTPIVSTDLAGYLNVATPGVDAVMVRPDDPDALADALRRVLADDELAEELRRNGTARAEHFSMEELARRYITIYERLVSTSPKASRNPDPEPPGSSASDTVRRMLNATSARRRHVIPHPQERA